MVYNICVVYEMFPASNNPDAQFIGFASDNYAGAHPNVLKWLSLANESFARPYNDDEYTKQFRVLANELFGKEVSVFPTLNGTGTNVLSLRAVLPRWGTVCSPETAHINTDEAGAPEHMAGLKIMTAPTQDGKITPSDIATIAKALGDIHSAQPAIVSISNTTERGTFYTAEEIGSLTQQAHSHNMLIHIDGARIFNAVVAAGYTSLSQGLKEMYGQTGVDIISLGGTKVGAINAEAVVVMHSENSPLSQGAKFSQKQMGQLASKARYCSAQFLALFEDDLAFHLAKYSNEKMQEFFEKFQNATNAKQSQTAYLSGATSAYASNLDTSSASTQELFDTQTALNNGLPNQLSSHLSNHLSSHLSNHLSNQRFISYESRPSANAFFPTLPTDIIARLRESYHFYDISPNALTTTIRLMTSFATTSEQIDGFISLLHTLI